MKNDLKAALKGKLPHEELSLVYKSYDVIGDIAVIRVPEQLLHRRKIVAEALMLQHKHVKAVWMQSSPVSGDFRLRDLEWVAGEKRTETVHKEHGCVFKVDIKESYFSPRLGFERMRIANLVEENDMVLNMFAGVGCYSIVIARHSNVAKVYSIDINPAAVEYMRENVLLNKIVGKVIPMKGDARRIVGNTLKGAVSRVLMPLPEKALEYIDSAMSALRSQGGWIHYYAFEHTGLGEDAAEKAKARIEEKLIEQKAEFLLSSSRIVRQTGPNWCQVAVDIRIGN